MINRTIYEEIGKRAGGDIYIGVVGPVRTGKSTFIKRFMDVMVFPHMINSYEKTRVMDELPQSGEGRTITTTEPKFIPPEAATVSAGNGVQMKVRLVDCVGYLVPGVLGDKEEGAERMVSTPWSAEQMSFSQAAELGTEKVIREHSVVGIVVTTDGSFGELPRENFTEAEERTIAQLKNLQQPFVVLLNTVNPQSQKTRELAAALEEKYEVPVLSQNCQRMQAEDFDLVFHRLLLQFPACEIAITLPGYLDALPKTHWIKETMIAQIRDWTRAFETMGQALDTCPMIVDGTVMKEVRIARTDPANGLIVLQPQLAPDLYYKVIEELLDAKVENDSQLFCMLRAYAEAKKAYDGLKSALTEAEKENYGIVAPKLFEMTLEKPEVFKQGSKYGVRMKATAPCMHIIKTNITTEVSPVVGTESQSVELARNLSEQFDKGEDSIWETNLFGKTLKEMVTEQMESKVSNVPEHLRGKVQRSLQKISDEGKDYFICIIL